MHIPDLTQVSKAELEKELKRREIEEIKARNAERQRIYDLVRQNVDFLLGLQTKHDTTSCSDANPCGKTNDPSRHRLRCTRCQLLDIKQHNYNDEFVVDITVRHDPREDEGA